MTKRKRILARKLIFAILMFSSFVTLFSIGGQLYFEYQRDISSLKSIIDRIRDTYLPAISSSLWAYDLELVEIQLEGIRKIPGVHYLAILDASGKLIDVGTPIASNGIIEELELSLTEGTKKYSLGRLRIELSLSEVYERLLNRLTFIVTTQAAKTFLVATFMFMLIHTMIGRHMAAIAAYLRDLSLTRMEKPLALSRYRPIRKIPDELDDIESSINEMRENIQKEIIERKQTEEMKNSLERRLIQSQKLEAIGTLAGGIAHDFNNILAVILGNAELIREKGGDVSDSVKNLDNLLKAGYRAKDLINHILAFSRKADHEPTLIQPATIVKEAIKFLRASIPSTVVIHQKIENDCGSIEMDPTQMHQILMNLCTNAYQALEDTGGEINIALKKIELAVGSLVDSPELQGEFIELTISDNGPGIPENIKHRIFEPYFTTKGVGRGTGMGLSIVYGIVSASGGNVSCVSEKGTGTTFRVLIPHKNTEHSEFHYNANTDAGLLPRGKENIFCVDDEVDLLKVIEAQLKSLGYSVTKASQATEALDLLKENPLQHDLIITDQSMPGMDGIELAHLIRNVRPDIPMILATGYSKARPEKESQLEIFDKILRKPILLQDLALSVREILDSKQLEPKV